MKPPGKRIRKEYNINQNKFKCFTGKKRLIIRDTRKSHLVTGDSKDKLSLSSQIELIIIQSWKYK